MTKRITLCCIAIFIYLLNLAQPFEEAQKLLPSDGVGDDNFGESVCISGNYAIVGAPGDYSTNIQGYAYIYFNNSCTWEQEIKLIASDGSAGDWFGASVSISGDYAIVGAPWDGDNGNRSGSAYIFYNNSGIWEQQTKLIASDGSSNDWFGASVGISEDVIIIGAPNDSDAGYDIGSAYIFYNNSGIWEEVSKLTASDGTPFDNFGVAVSISGDNAIIGAYGADVGAYDSGAAYIFINIFGNWVESTILTASDGAEDDWFGRSVNISDNQAIIGAPRNTSNEDESGSAYIFNYNSGNWEEYTKLSASDGTEGDRFGWSVSCFGSFAIVGADSDDDIEDWSGSAYIYFNNDGVWEQQSKLLPSDGAWGDYFGRSVSIYKGNAIFGAPGDDDFGYNSGSAYLFRTPIPNISLQPVSQNDICGNSVVFFNIISENTDTFQWQESTNSGLTYTDIMDGDVYTGSATDTLFVLANLSLDDYLYRCNVSSFSCSIFSDAAILNLESEAPVITCVETQIIDLLEGQILYTVAGTEFDPVSLDDNCGVESVINNFNNTTSLQGAEFPIDTTTVIWTAIDDAGNESDCSFDVIVNKFVGIEEFELNGISVHPNPTSGKINLDFGDKIIQRIEIFDLNGKTILKKTEIQQNETIDMSPFENGIYTLTILTSKNIITTKVVKN